MSKEQLDAFTAEAIKDENLLMKLASSSAEDVVSLAKDRGFDITVDDLNAAAQKAIDLGQGERVTPKEEDCLPWVANSLR